VAIFGGYVTDGDAESHVATGALYDLETAAWSTVPTWPFAEGPYRPGLVIAADTLIVLGQPCAAVSVEEDQADCGATGLAAARYDAAAARWSELSSPTIDLAAGSTMTVQGYGANASAAFFSVSNGNAVVTLEFDIAAGTWSGVKEPVPMDIGDQNADVCFVGDKLFTATVDYEAAALHSWVWDRSPGETGAWSSLGDASLPNTDALDRATNEQLRCSAQQYMYFSYANDRLNSPLLWLDGGSRTWVPVATPPLGGFDSRIAGASVPAGRVLWPTAESRSAQYFALASDETAWRALPVSLPPLVRMLTTDSNVIAVSEPERVAVPSFGIIGLS
jgi:hypothetical protein